MLFVIYWAYAAFAFKNLSGKTHGAKSSFDTLDAVQSAPEISIFV